MFKIKSQQSLAIVHKIMHIRSLGNSCFSSLPAAWDVSPGDTSAPSGQKFHANDVRLDCKPSLFFFRFSAGSACMRKAARHEKSGQQLEKSLPSRAFSHACGHLRVLRVSLDELRKKRDCS